MAEEEDTVAPFPAMVEDVKSKFRELIAQVVEPDGAGAHTASTQERMFCRQRRNCSFISFPGERTVTALLRAAKTLETAYVDAQLAHAPVGNERLALVRVGGLFETLVIRLLAVAQDIEALEREVAEKDALIAATKASMQEWLTRYEAILAQQRNTLASDVLNDSNTSGAA